MKYIDISPEISEDTAVFPGDQAFERHQSLDGKKGDAFTLSSIRTTVHVGAHADAPSHYHVEGEGISTRGLHYYLGPCQVISVEKKACERIKPEDIKGLEIRHPRILFKTGSFAHYDKWTNDFNSLSPELIEYLVQKKVILVGIDTPSIDPATEKVLHSHHAVYKYDLAVLEGVILSEVVDGDYQLIALPLKIKDADASPVRAVLVDL